MYAKRGFTLVELLIIVAIIGILSSVVLVSLRQAMANAQHARVAEDLRQIEIAMNLIHTQYGCWPRESATGCVMPGFNGETQVSSLVGQATGLGAYLADAPVFPLPHAGTNYILDNDGDAHNPATCASDSTQGYRGVVVTVRHGSEDISAVYQYLNDVFDKDADPMSATAQRCGKVRYISQDIFYSISDAQ